METSLPSCDLRHSDSFSLAGEGGVVLLGTEAGGGRRLEHSSYCVSGPILWYCRAALNR